MTHSPSRAPPVVGIPCCTKQIGLHPFHIGGDKYIRAVSEGADCLPFLIPALGSWYDTPALLDRLDGLLITGSPSNVEPRHYGGPPAPPGTLQDPDRDATTLSLIRAAMDRGLPMLLICRGLQELNVVMGGTLHQAVHAVDGRADHRADDTRTAAVQYGPAHPVALAEGGLLARLFGQHEIQVNSIHSQGIDRLADGLVVEATAPDGQIEAVRAPAAPGLVLALQWHPEWQFQESEEGRALFRFFGDTVRDYVRKRAGSHAAE